jgi:hypothetical protein
MLRSPMIYIKSNKILPLLVFAAGVVLLHSPLSGQPPETQSQCVICHTDVKRLIRLGWEIEKLRPKKKASAEISGEG